MPDFIPEDDLLEKLKAGDETCFTQLFHAWRDKLFSYCIRVTKDEAAAEEIVQDVFIKIWTHREQIDRARHFDALLFTITKRLALNYLKKVARYELLKKAITTGTSGTDHGTEDWVYDRDYQHLLQQAIHTLPPQRRRIFEMSREEYCTHDEIARKLSISKNTVRNQIISATQTIRHYLSSNSHLPLPFIVFLISLFH